MSNKSYAWMAGTLIIAIIVIGMMLEHMKEINDALGYVKWAAIALAILAVLYGAYRLWHVEHLRSLDRQERRHAIAACKQQALEQEYRASLIQEEAESRRTSRLMMEQTRLMMADARVNGDEVKMEYGNDGTIKMLHVTKPQVNAALLQQLSTQMAQLQGTGKGQLALPSGDDEVPQAPPFAEMCHLLTPERMVLCYTKDGPAYGTTDDLLSMIITGKPGRGKTTALMYYVTMLLQAGAEVWVWDPHGAMNELAILNNKRLSGMPATARVVYLDRKPDIVASVPRLQAELADRDEYYRANHKAKHPLLLLADELPVLADYDEQVVQEYKVINKQHTKDNEDIEEVPSLITIIRRFVLEARKWRCFFIGSGQSVDAEILPTRVTDAMNSRIVFFNSDRKARMSGLENDAIKHLLPAIRRGGSGVMIFDCSRWDEPVVGSIPMITVPDMLKFLGGHRETFGSRLNERESVPEAPYYGSPAYSATTIVEAPNYALSAHNTGPLENVINEPVDLSGDTPESLPAFGTDDYQMNDVQIEQFKVLYPALGSIEKALKQINNAKGQSLGNRYHKHASVIVKQYDLRKGSK